MKGYHYIKRGIDIILSGMAIVILSPLLLFLCIAIKLDTPGPILFKQKRVGIHRSFFQIYKFRTMRIDTPKDVPTHMLENPEQYITKVGKFLRKTSLDELPQIFNIFKGEMSIVGPRPALWNQDDLVAEREKYGANDVTPGLTGWAQINGRDELEIPDKARLDGEYVKHLGPWMDLKCFLGTIGSVLMHDGVVEGGTGELNKEEEETEAHKSETAQSSAKKETIAKDTEESEKGRRKKKILITGSGSYVGTSVEAWLRQWPEYYQVDTLDMRTPTWRTHDFSAYDVVYHVAGIAHADVGQVTEEEKKQYYRVNTDLAVETAEKAKKEGVQQFLFMSSMIVYGESAPYGKRKVIDATTIPQPANFYGDSKLQADVAVRELADDTYKVIVLRPPMIYGKGSKGNYRTLAKLAKKLPVFPNVDNERSMLYIENLCEFLCQIMLLKPYHRNSVVLLPQNGEWTKTSDMVKQIAKASGKRIAELKCLAPTVKMGSKMPGKIGGLVNKAFGNNFYNKRISHYDGLNYQLISVKKSIVKTEE